MKRLIISVILAMVLLVLPAGGVFAASTATVNVTATPSMIEISINNPDWTINGISGTGLLDVDTFYYSQASQSETTIFGEPVSAANCRNLVTNSSTVDITLKADMANFSSGDAMTNAGDGANAANVYAAFVQAAGSNWSTAQIMETTGSTVFWTSSSPGEDIEVAFGVETQTGAWGSGTSMTSSILLTAAPA